MLTINELRASFSQIRARQGAPRPVSILSKVPVLFTKIFTIKAEARGTKIYPLVMTFYNVDYSLERDKQHPFLVRPRVGEPFFMQPLSETQNPVQLRCQCPFFRFAWAEGDKESKALSGPTFPAYIQKTARAPRPSVNPQQLPGICKHLVGLITKLESDRLLGA